MLSVELQHRPPDPRLLAPHPRRACGYLCPFTHSIVCLRTESERGDRQLILFLYIEGWYNTHRRHSALGQRSPLAFEQQHAVRSLAA